MQSDLPHVLYGKRRKTGEDGKPKGNTVASDEVIRLQEEANRRMMERKAAKGGAIQYDLEELYK